MSDFKISPKKDYKNPNYPTPSKLFASLKPALLAVGAGAGILAAGCAPPNPWAQNNSNNNNNNILDGVAVECMPGDIMCTTDSEIAECVTDDGWNHFEYKDCNTWCNDNFGMDWVSYGVCSEEITDNPCQCEYDILDGGIGFCSEEEFYCAEDGDIMVCNDSGTDFDEQTCDDYCAEQWGSEMFLSTKGCDSADNEDPCGCVYGMMDGMVAECTMDDLYCVSDKAIGVCENEVDYTYYKCEDLCKELDPQAVSTGCDAEQEGDPCLCEIPE